MPEDLLRNSCGNENNKSCPCLDLSTSVWKPWWISIGSLVACISIESRGLKMISQDWRKASKIKWDAKVESFIGKARWGSFGHIQKRHVSKRGRISEILFVLKVLSSQFEKWKLQIWVKSSLLFVVVMVLRLVFFGFGSLVCFVFVFDYYFVLCFWRPSALFVLFWVLGSWHVAKLSSFGPLELYSSWRGPRRDHLVGGGNSLPHHKKSLLEYIYIKIGRSAVLRQDGQCVEMSSAGSHTDARGFLRISQVSQFAGCFKIYINLYS